ncbi:MAG: ZIP family metal transporter, partial [Bacteroidales bacterium]|nr:ZIP family metal transporter [Bacteroidales bacterium]
MSDSTPIVITSLLIPFLGTALGSAFVFVMRKEISQNVQKGLMGFASGIMIAASVWS